MKIGINDTPHGQIPDGIPNITKITRLLEFCKKILLAPKY